MSSRILTDDELANIVEFTSRLAATSYCRFYVIKAADSILGWRVDAYSNSPTPQFRITLNNLPSVKVTASSRFDALYDLCSIKLKIGLANRVQNWIYIDK